MKKTFSVLTAILLLSLGAGAQDAYIQSMQAAVTRLDKAASAKDYQQLAGEFQTIADRQKKDWLPYYYAALCNAKTGWLLRDDGDKIEPFADQADEEIRKAQSLLDTATQKKQLSEVYCVLSMTNQARVFINPQTYGAKYGRQRAAIVNWPKNRSRQPQGFLYAWVGKIYYPKIIGAVIKRKPGNCWRSQSRN